MSHVMHCPHVLSPLRQQLYNLSFFFPWCVCVCVSIVIVCNCVLLKGMLECASVFVLYCLMVLFYYIIVLHYVRRLECIWRCAIQIPF